MRIHCGSCDHSFLRRDDRRQVCPACGSDAWSILPRADVEQLVSSNLSLAFWATNKVMRGLTPGQRERFRDGLESDAQFLLFTAARRFNPANGTAFSTYATTAILRRLYASLRAELDGMQTAVFDDETWQVEGREREPLQALEASDFSEVMLSRLTPRERETVEQHTCHGSTYREIGEQQGLTTQRMHSIHRSALEKLREMAAA